MPGHEAARRHLLAAGYRTVPAGVDSEAVYFQDPIGLIFDMVERT
ncbi:MAG TPA: hypothetical protein VHQ45_02860 [Gemmatimonadaceae bacterium]|nr:hypothetical protein [Gemmatimonadaceae bacterium]